MKQNSLRPMLGGVCLATMMMAAGSARAIPTLQLDIGGGTYVAGGDDTTYANSSVFTLYALNSGAPSGTFYISAAIQPRQGLASPPPNVGTFTFNGGTPISTSDMNWGVPPVAITGVGDLPDHGAFDTYYVEFAFTFSSLQCASYDAATALGDPSTHPGTGMYYQSFQIDVSSLLSSYSVHFDLYDEAVKNKNHSSLAYAPFTHDAQSGPGGDNGNSTPGVPDSGTTIALLGFALAGVDQLRRRIVKA